MSNVCVRLVDDSDPSVDTCFDMDLHACSQPAAFLIPFSRCTHIMPFTYVYALFASDLVLVKFVAVGKTLNSVACTIPVVAAYCIYTMPSW